MFSYNGQSGSVTLLQQHCCKAVHGLTSLLRGIRLVAFFYMTVGAKTR